MTAAAIAISPEIAEERWSLDLAVLEARDKLVLVGAIARSAHLRSASLAEVQDPVEDVLAACARALRELELVVLG